MWRVRTKMEKKEELTVKKGFTKEVEDKNASGKLVSEVEKKLFFPSPTWSSLSF